MSATPEMQRLDELVPPLLQLAAAGRHLIAIAGAPGSGKSTLADRLQRTLNEQRADSAVVVPMDGFHYDDAVLSARGTLARKGAPFTFDLGGLAAMLQRLRANAEPEVAVPVFDRDLEISRAGARIVAATTPLILVEGNYLLLDDPGWRDLRPLFDLTIRLEVAVDELERRLIQRWLDQGFARDLAQARARQNDLPNAERVCTRAVPADILFRP